MAKKEDVPQSMRDAATIIGKQTPTAQQPQPDGPNFMGIPINEDFVAGLVTRVQVIRCDGENKTFYTNGPIVPEAGTLGLVQAFALNDADEIIEHRCLVFIGVEVQIDQAIPPYWWKNVLKKDYVKANEVETPPEKE